MPPIDPPTSPRYALEGRVVTMNNAFEVHNKARIYVDQGTIQAIVPVGEPVPPSLADAKVIRTSGTIYPGLIELHNHLSFNMLPAWVVPKKFAHRGLWPLHPDYRALIKGPASVLGSTSGLIEAVVRYVEIKCLVAGVTTSQGITLRANSGIKRFYKGLVRNVEETGDPELPDAQTRIEDVVASDVRKFLERLEGSTSLLLHLSEGFGPTAHKHFRALQLDQTSWAITGALAGIHCTGLSGDDFGTLHSHGGTMIWSPLSNVLLYGDTADIVQARDSGVVMALGSDWSPSGSKNVLGELKMARVWSDRRGGVFSSRELVSMVTRNPARILKWQERLGSIRPAARADFLVLEGVTGDVYDDLIEAREDDVTLVVINGVPRFGRPSLMESLDAPVTESVTVGGEARDLSLDQATGDPLVGALTLAEARDRLTDALGQLPRLAAQLENPVTAFTMLGSRESTPAGATGIDARNAERWVIDFDHESAGGLTSRPQLPFGAEGERTGVFVPSDDATPLSQVLQPLELDALTVVDDDHFGERLARQPNVEVEVKRTLAQLLGVTLPA